MWKLMTDNRQPPRHGKSSHGLSPCELSVLVLFLYSKKVGLHKHTIWLSLKVPNCIFNHWIVFMSLSTETLNTIITPLSSIYKFYTTLYLLNII
jgi:hypothetical protein